MTRAEVEAVASAHMPTLRQLPIYQGYQAKGDRIVILVSKKPKAGQLPTSLDGVPVDYKVVGKLGAMTWNKRERPAIGGISVGHYEISAGTLGAVVPIGEKLYVLSNNHVLANCNQANKGDPIYQPGPYDGGTEADTIAHLHSWKELQADQANHIDVAIAEAIAEKVDTLIKGTKPAPPELLTTPDTYAIELAEGDTCFKNGRTTETTRGKVILESAQDVQIRNYPQGTLIFDDVVLVESLESGLFVDNGDSGSAVLTPDGRFCGLVFAGGPKFGVYCKIKHILDWIFEDFKFRPARYTASREWMPAYMSVGLVGGGVALGAREETKIIRR